MNWLKALLGAPIEIIASAYESRQIRKMQERKLQFEIVAQKIENVRAGKMAEVAWNGRSIANSSWRDEYLTILLSLPLILIFGPDAVQAQIADGFAELQNLPAWYISGVGLMIGSAFGYQKYTNLVMNRAYTLPAAVPHRYSGPLVSDKTGSDKPYKPSGDMS